MRVITSTTNDMNYSSHALCYLMVNTKCIVNAQNDFFDRRLKTQILLQNMWIKWTRVFEINHIQDGDSITHF